MALRAPSTALRYAATFFATFAARTPSSVRVSAAAAAATAASASASAPSRASMAPARSWPRRRRAASCTPKRESSMAWWRSTTSPPAPGAAASAATRARQSPGAVLPMASSPFASRATGYRGRAGAGRSRRPSPRLLRREGGVAHGEDRAGRAPDDGLGHGSEEHAPDPRAPVGADHDHVGAPGRRLAEDLVRGGADDDLRVQADPAHAARDLAQALLGRLALALEELRVVGDADHRVHGRRRRSDHVEEADRRA